MTNLEEKWFVLGFRRNVLRGKGCAPYAARKDFCASCVCLCLACVLLGQCLAWFVLRKRRTKLGPQLLRYLCVEETVKQSKKARKDSESGTAARSDKLNARPHSYKKYSFMSARIQIQTQNLNLIQLQKLQPHLLFVLES